MTERELAAIVEQERRRQAALDGVVFDRILGRYVNVDTGELLPEGKLSVVSRQLSISDTAPFHQAMLFDLQPIGQAPTASPTDN